MKLKTYTVKRTLRSFASLDAGWGNGYVAIPVEHPLHGVHYNDIDEKHDLWVHGGITYSESANQCSKEVIEELELDGSEWVFGFDTAHYCDNQENWNESAVRKELANFAKQLEEIPPNEPRHGSHLVCYVYPDGGDADYEAFDTEAEAVERYEALVGFGYKSVTIAKPVRSTDYDCEPA